VPTGLPYRLTRRNRAEGTLRGQLPGGFRLPVRRAFSPWRELSAIGGLLVPGRAIYSRQHRRKSGTYSTTSNQKTRS